jgi:hypothetical protein
MLPSSVHTGFSKAASDSAQKLNGKRLYVSVLRTVTPPKSRVHSEWVMYCLSVCAGTSAKASVTTHVVARTRVRVTRGCTCPLAHRRGPGPSSSVFAATFKGLLRRLSAASLCFASHALAVHTHTPPSATRVAPAEPVLLRASRCGSTGAEVHRILALLQRPKLVPAATQRACVSHYVGRATLWGELYVRPPPLSLTRHTHTHTHSLSLSHTHKRSPPVLSHSRVRRTRRGRQSAGGTRGTARATGDAIP